MKPFACRLKHNIYKLRDLTIMDNYDAKISEMTERHNEMQKYWNWGLKFEQIVHIKQQEKLDKHI